MPFLERALYTYTLTGRMPQLYTKLSIIAKHMTNSTTTITEFSLVRVSTYYLLSIGGVFNRIPIVWTFIDSIMNTNNTEQQTQCRIFCWIQTLMSMMIASLIISNDYRKILKCLWMSSSDNDTITLSKAEQGDCQCRQRNLCHFLKAIESVAFWKMMEIPRCQSYHTMGSRPNYKPINTTES